MKINKKQVPDFEEMKDSRFQYRYSRSERLKLYPVHSAKFGDYKGFARFFGGNKMVVRMLIFYILLGAFVFLALFLHDNMSEMQTRRIFNEGKTHKIEVRLIKDKKKHGLNIVFENASHKNNWIMSGLTRNIDGKTKETNLNLTLAPGEFEVIFWNTPDTLSNIAKMTIKSISPSTNP